MNLKWVARITGNILDELLHNSIQSGNLEIVCLMHLSIICASSITSSNWWFTVWLTTDTFFSPCLAAGLSWDSYCYFANKWWETAVLPHIVAFLLLHWQTLPVCSISSLLWQNVPGDSWVFLLAPAILAHCGRQLPSPLSTKQAALNAPLCSENLGPSFLFPLVFTSTCYFLL